MDSFADIFFFLLLPRSGWREWERLAAEEKKNEWLASGWIIRKEIGARRVKKQNKKNDKKEKRSKDKN